MATFIVTNLFDSGAGSLRDFIAAANDNEGADTIDFDSMLSGTINLTSGELGIRDDLTINGLGTKLLRVDEDTDPFRIFNVDDGNESNDLEVAINELTISGGSEQSFTGGGGIFNSENLIVSSSTISGNSADFGGGGIYNTGNLTVSNSTISGNFEVELGGSGILNRGNLSVVNSTISGNSTAGEFNGGGGIHNTGNLTVSNSTISGNSAYLGSGGIDNNGSSATITSSIIAANRDNKDVSGTFTSAGNNLIGSGDGATGFTNGVKGDLVGTAANPINPQLGLLQNNGGPTQTQALLPGSPATNAGSNPLNLEFDQRGPGFERVVGTQADIGAVAVPEPDSTLGLLGVAFLGVVFLRKRKQRPGPMM